MPNNKVDPTIAHVAFGRPIPGQSLAAHAPRNTPWQQPPHYTQLDEAMNGLFDKLTKGPHIRDLLSLMHAGMSIEEIARTILFTGFTQGEWTPTLMMLMYKPLMLLLISIAKKADLGSTPVVAPTRFNEYHNNKQDMHNIFSQAAKQHMNSIQKPDTIVPDQPPDIPQNTGFMQRGSI
jgi:hypothetical protein